MATDQAMSRRSLAGFVCEGPRVAVVCHWLCHNPAIQAGVVPPPSVSLGHTQEAANLRGTRMNTASAYHFVCQPMSQCSFAPGNGMEEVVGSIPTGSTIDSERRPPSNHIAEDPDPARNFDILGP
jgi:hypothetical protein